MVYPDNAVAFLLMTNFSQRTVFASFGPAETVGFYKPTSIFFTIAACILHGFSCRTAKLVPGCIILQLLCGKVIGWTNGCSGFVLYQRTQAADADCFLTDKSFSVFYTNTFAKHSCSCPHTF